MRAQTEVDVETGVFHAIPITRKMGEYTVGEESLADVIAACDINKARKCLAMSYSQNYVYDGLYYRRGHLVRMI